MANAYQYRFSQVMDIKEQEKNEAEMAYKESVTSFEEIATHMYDALKKKEDLLAFQQEKMQSGLSILEMHNYANFIDSMEKRLLIYKKKLFKHVRKCNGLKKNF